MPRISFEGPGRNLFFCSVTTGINIDPDHGCLGRQNYEVLKSIITEKAELHYEHPLIREVKDIDASTILPGYSGKPRTLYQFLFAGVDHNFGWKSDRELEKAIDQASIFQGRLFRPIDGEYSMDFEASKEAGMMFLQNAFIIPSNVWVQHLEFYYSTCRPGLSDGEAGDAWLVSLSTSVDDAITRDFGCIEIWYKPAFEWVRLNDYVQTTTPPGTLSFSLTDPGNSTNSWWFDPTGIVFRKFNGETNFWDPAPPLTFSPTPPTGLSDGDLWLKVDNGKFVLHVFDGGISSFRQAITSALPVQDKATNSAFKSIPEDERNFTIVSNDDSLVGKPIILGENDLEVRKDGVTIATLVNCLNFIGPDLDVSKGIDCVDVEHLPVTTLPEQGGAPISIANAGKVFTLEVTGRTELFYIDDAGNLIQLTNNGTTVQNIFLDVSTANAVAGQVSFSIPGTAKAVLTVKVNGVDTTAYTFSTPTVTYLPIAGGYTIQTGDVVSVLYYGS